MATHGESTAFDRYDLAMARIPLSVLDLSLVTSGGTSSDALSATTELAKRADTHGFERFWVAEHHNTGAVASCSPPVLIAHLAASTERISVGSGGVMLANHAPFVVAEQFAMLEALHPGRIDLGIGRAPGTDPATMIALRRGIEPIDVDEFPQHVIDVMGLLGDVRSDNGMFTAVKATPNATSRPTVALLGSSGYLPTTSAWPALGPPPTFTGNTSPRRQCLTSPT